MINTRLLRQENLFLLEQLINIILELAVVILLLHTGNIAGGENLAFLKQQSKVRARQHHAETLDPARPKVSKGTLCLLFPPLPSFFPPPSLSHFCSFPPSPSSFFSLLSFFLSSLYSFIHFVLSLYLDFLKLTIFSWNGSNYFYDPSDDSKGDELVETHSNVYFTCLYFLQCLIHGNNRHFLDVFL